MYTHQCVIGDCENCVWEDESLCCPLPLPIFPEIETHAGLSKNRTRQCKHEDSAGNAAGSYNKATVEIPR
jgi:hypothetical protein